MAKMISCFFLAVSVFISGKVLAEPVSSGRLIEAWRLTLCLETKSVEFYKTGAELRTYAAWRVEALSVHFPGEEFAKYLDWRGDAVVEKCVLSLEMERHHDGRRLLFEIGPGGSVLNGVRVEKPEDVEAFLRVVHHMLTWGEEWDWYQSLAVGSTDEKEGKKFQHGGKDTPQVDRFRQKPGGEQGSREELLNVPQGSENVVIGEGKGVSVGDRGHPSKDSRQ